MTGDRAASEIVWILEVLVNGAWIAFLHEREPPKGARRRRHGARLLKGTVPGPNRKPQWRIVRSWRPRA